MTDAVIRDARPGDEDALYALVLQLGHALAPDRGAYDATLAEYFAGVHSSVVLLVVDDGTSRLGGYALGLVAFVWALSEMARRDLPEGWAGRAHPPASFSGAPGAGLPGGGERGSGPRPLAGSGGGSGRGGGVAGGVDDDRVD